MTVRVSLADRPSCVNTPPHTVEIEVPVTYDERDVR